MLKFNIVRLFRKFGGKILEKEHYGTIICLKREKNQSLMWQLLSKLS